MITRMLLAAAALGATLSTAAEALPLLTSPLVARTGPDRSAWIEPPARKPAPAVPGPDAATAEKRDTLAAATPAPATPDASKAAPPVVADSAPAKAAAVEARVRPVRRAAPVRNVRRIGGSSYAFSGSFGGCRFHGMAGPGGFTLDRSC